MHHMYCQFLSVSPNVIHFLFVHLPLIVSLFPNVPLCFLFTPHRPNFSVYLDPTCYSFLCLKVLISAICTKFLSVCRKSWAGVGIPSTCCFVSQSALLTEGPSTVQAARRAPAGATYTRSSRSQILHSSFKCNVTNTSNVLPMEDVRRQLTDDMICSPLE
jgi:hypothetical protein